MLDCTQPANCNRSISKQVLLPHHTVTGGALNLLIGSIHTCNMMQLTSCLCRCVCPSCLHNVHSSVLALVKQSTSTAYAPCISPSL
jgi:hypothetical protein